MLNLPRSYDSVSILLATYAWLSWTPYLAFKSRQSIWQLQQEKENVPSIVLGLTKIMEAVHLLHEENIVIGDLRLPRIFYDESKNFVVLVDFDWSELDGKETRAYAYSCSTRKGRVIVTTTATTNSFVKHFLKLHQSVPFLILRPTDTSVFLQCQHFANIPTCRTWAVDQPVHLFSDFFEPPFGNFNLIPLQPWNPQGPQH